MKNQWTTIATFLAITASVVILIFSCIAAASDAQGAILFIVTFPLMFALLGLGVVLSGKSRKEGKRLGKLGYRISLSGIWFLAAFLVCAFIPGLNAFPRGVMDGVVSVYKLVYGMSPYEAAHQPTNTEFSAPPTN